MRNNHPYPNEYDYWQKLLLQTSQLWWTPLNYAPEDFQRISAPTLVLMGEKDEMIPLEEAHELSNLIPGSELMIIPGAAHNDVMKEGSFSMGFVLDFLLVYLN
jgi:pimeloyl-ACP methyl ester carboxylesterase